MPRSVCISVSFVTGHHHEIGLQWNIWRSNDRLLQYLRHTHTLRRWAIIGLCAEQQVLEARLEQLQQQRSTMEGELQSLSTSFHATTVDNQNLHQHVQVCRFLTHGLMQSRSLSYHNAPCIATQALHVCTAATLELSSRQKEPCFVQALQQHRRKQEALHMELCAQRDQLVGASTGKPKPPRHSSSAYTASVPTLPRPPPASSLASCMPPLPSLPAAMLHASGDGGRALHEAVGALPACEQPILCPPSVPCGTGPLQDAAMSPTAQTLNGGHELLPRLPPLLPFSMAEWSEDRGAARQPVHGVATDIFLPLPQHGRYGNIKEQVMHGARGGWCSEVGCSAC